MSKEKIKRKMKKQTKNILITIFFLVVALVASAGIYCYLQTNPFDKGNDMAECQLENVSPLASSPLTGKNIIYLGSSVTQGFGSNGVSFVEYISKLDSCSYVKEAVPGTTLVDDSDKSYIARLKKLDPSIKADCIIVQLSTNDAIMYKKLGAISDSTNLQDFNTKTVAGSIEYIISYARQTWNCPVVFYTQTRAKFDNKNYAKMVEVLLQIQKKWDIGVIDLWNDPEMNAVSAENIKLYQPHGVHPTKAGYLLWWTPKFEAFLYEYLK